MKKRTIFAEKTGKVTKTKIYFLSDIHLGAPYINEHVMHERRLVDFLESIKEEAKEIYFLGDVFDFWFEYKRVIPRGFVRFQAKVAELADSGVAVHFFAGNHDMWMFDYFQQELGVQVHYRPMVKKIGKRTLFLAHGEDLGSENRTFKALLRLFRTKWVQRMFSVLIHPNSAIRFARNWSMKSRRKNGEKESTAYLGEDKEHLVQFAKHYKGEEAIDYFIFGHRHIVLDLIIKKDSHVIILGDWLSHFSYALLENDHLSLAEYTKA